MGLMLTLVIPSIAEILINAGQELPIYTRIVIGASDFLEINYIVVILFCFANRRNHVLAFF